MADLVKGVLGGAWSLIIGWVLPAFLFLQLVVALILADLKHLDVIARFLGRDLAVQQATMLAISAVAGLVFAAAQAPLYRVLEGTSPLWPQRVADARSKAHRTRRAQLVEEQLAAANTNRGILAGLLYERAARYPVQDKQIAPTALGNAIRRFETYAGDRYQLDSQLLWHDLTAAAPERATAAVEQARTNVDFFVSLVYGGASTTVLGLIGVTSSGLSSRSAIAVPVGMIIVFASYRLAVLATDEWDAAVRGLVDHGRKGVAEAFGLALPAGLAEERRMWRAVNTFVRRPYAYTEASAALEVFDQCRRSPTLPTNARSRSAGR